MNQFPFSTLPSGVKIYKHGASWRMDLNAISGPYSDHHLCSGGLNPEAVAERLDLYGFTEDAKTWRKSPEQLAMEQEHAAWLKTFRHIHVNNGTDDACARCGLDLRNRIHFVAL